MPLLKMTGLDHLLPVEHCSSNSLLLARTFAFLAFAFTVALCPWHLYLYLSVVRSCPPYLFRWHFGGLAP